VETLQLSTGKTKIAARDGSFGRYLRSGHLTYIRQGTMYAAAFDPVKLEMRGVPTPVLDNVAYDPTFGYAQLDVSQTGTLVYRRSGGAILGWINERGDSQPILRKPSQSVWPRISPDGTRIALTTVEGGEAVLWIHHLESGQAVRAASGARYSSLWTPDSRYLILGGAGGLSWIRADSPSTPKPLTDAGVQVPVSFNEDGTRLAFHALSPETHFDLWTMPVLVSDDGVRSPGAPQSFLRTRAIETYPTFSPDGRWIAYASNESGVWEVYVRSFADNGKAVRVSSAGGRIARWGPNGPELFYRNEDHRVFVATYRIAERQFVVNGVRLWSATRLFDTGVFANYDVGGDGRVLGLLPAGTSEGRQSQNHVRVTLNFFEQVQQRVRATQR
jgi:serine/threonine-protein kinase